MAKQDASSVIVGSIESHLADVGEQLRTTSDEARAYVAERLEHLAGIAGEPGYDLALEAERDAIALRLANLAVDGAQEADRRLIGVIGYGLRVAAAAIAPS